MSKINFISFLLLNLFAFQFLGAVHPEARDYNAPLTENEKANIRYIITTLANTSTIGLAFYQKKLQQAGNNVDHVHPLKFLGYIFSDPKLKSDVPRIASMPWNRFANDMGESLGKAYQRENLKPEYIHEFAKQIGVPYESIQSYFQQRQWVSLIQALSGR